MSREKSLGKIYENQDYLKALSREIWSYAELVFKEEKSSEALCRALDKFGFKVEKMCMESLQLLKEPLEAENLL